MRIISAKSLLGSIAVTAAMSIPGISLAQSSEGTVQKDIEPILQRSCQNCHRPGGAGPMPLATYDQVAPFAGLIEYKTALRDRAGALPPCYLGKDTGLPAYKPQPS